MYEYHARVTNVVDGDTVDLDVDLGFGVTYSKRFRLMGINTPEIRTKDPEEKAAGFKAKARLEELTLDRRLVVRTTKDKPGKYGRILATLIDPENKIDINRQLLIEGLAKPYMAR